MNKIAKTLSMAVTFLALAAAPAFASEGGVKVECNGSCSTITLGQACATINGSAVPIAVACDDTALGSGTTVACGSGFGQCRQWQNYSSGDPLSGYCGDGGGWDAIVTCRW